MLKQHGKKIAGFGALGAVLPFLVGADTDVGDLAAGTDSASFWLVVAKLVAAALAPAATMAVGLFAAGLGAALVAYGRAKLADRDPSNDAFGAGLVALGRRLSPSADADATATPSEGTRPLLLTGSPSSPSSPPPSKNGP